MTKFTINSNDRGQTLFNFLKKCFKHTKLSIIYKWFRTNKIKVNGKHIKDKNRKLVLNNNDEVIVYDSSIAVKRDAKTQDIQSDLKLDIVYEDQNIIIVDKPANLEMHSEFNVSLDFLVRKHLQINNSYNPEAENSFVVSHIHRLDKLTRGIVVYAKNFETLRELNKVINDKTKVIKTYKALVENKFNWDTTKLLSGWIYYDYNLKISIFDIYKDKLKNPKPAIMEFSQIKYVENKNQTLIKIILHTGRKHQIRACMKYLKHPIINDFRYGALKNNEAKMIYLFATQIEFNNLTDNLSYLNEKIFKINLNLDV